MSLDKELYRHHAFVQNFDLEHVQTDKDKPENIFSYEQFIELKCFVEKLKGVPEIQKYLDEEERSKMYGNYTNLDDGELRLLRSSTVRSKSTKSQYKQ